MACPPSEVCNGWEFTTLAPVDGLWGFKTSAFAPSEVCNGIFQNLFLGFCGPDKMTLSSRLISHLVLWNVTLQSLSHNFPTDSSELFNSEMRCASHASLGSVGNGKRPFLTDFTVLLSGIPTIVGLKGILLGSNSVSLSS